MRQITNGPSKFNLMLALFDIVNGKQREVSFMVNSKHSRDEQYIVQINSVGAEDGSRESWIIEGWVKNVPHHSPHFKMYYRTDNREGHLTLD